MLERSLAKDHRRIWGGAGGRGGEGASCGGAPGVDLQRRAAALGGGEEEQDGGPLCPPGSEMLRDAGCWGCGRAAQGVGQQVRQCHEGHDDTGGGVTTLPCPRHS